MDSVVTIEIDPDLCIGAGECVAMAPGVFALEEDDVITRVISLTAPDDLLQSAAGACPTGAVRITKS